MKLHQAAEELEAETRELARLQRLEKARSFLKIFLIGFFIWKDLTKRISELSSRMENLQKNVRKLCALGINELAKRVQTIENSDTYLTYSDKAQCLTALNSFSDNLEYLSENGILDQEFVLAIKKRLEKCSVGIENYNREFVERRKREYSYLWRNGLLNLDEEQQEAIITDDKHNLVVAAAGSGKTETLITRIAYLIARKPDSVPPKRILAIAYQRKAREEIEQRLHDRFHIRQRQR